MRTDIKGRELCEGRLADGSYCGSLGKFDVERKKYCRKHQEQLSADRKRYREYQESAFGAVVFTWSDDQLRSRKAELGPEIEIADKSGTDTHLARLDAEATAITRELERRRATA